MTAPGTVLFRDTEEENNDTAENHCSSSLWEEETLTRAVNAQRGPLLLDTNEAASSLGAVEQSLSSSGAL